jgi:hypothetical protein
MRTDAPDVTFGAINKEEHTPISEFLQGKKLKVKNEILDEMIGTTSAVVRFWLSDRSRV